MGVSGYEGLRSTKKTALDPRPRYYVCQIQTGEAILGSFSVSCTDLCTSSIGIVASAVLRIGVMPSKPWYLSITVGIAAWRCCLPWPVFAKGSWSCCPVQHNAGVGSYFRIHLEYTVHRILARSKLDIQNGSSRLRQMMGRGLRSMRRMRRPE
ncbi:hypothetical protein BDW62DRAFT_86211 [Aspergillus aurantiobrunneus]